MTTVPPEPVSLGPGAQKSMATRAALLKLATELFAEKGYMQTSIRDIARRGSMTTGAIYGHFRNKADLLVEAINARIGKELEELAIAPNHETSHVEILSRLAGQYPTRRALRALILQGAAAAQIDEEMRKRLRDEQLSHLNSWIKDYEANRDHLGIDPSVDLQAAVLFTWAAEVGLGVLEAVGIVPKSRKGWADMYARFGRGLLLQPADAAATVSGGKVAPPATTSRRTRRRS